MLQAAFLVLPLGGCWITGKPPEPGLDIPAAYSAGPKKPAIADAATPTLDWRHSFRSRELTDILDNASVANLDIAAAVARIVQADAQSRITGAALLPQVDLNGSATRSRSSQSTSGGSGTSFGASEHDLLSTSLTASYEIESIDAEKGRSLSKVEVVNQHGEPCLVGTHVMRWLPPEESA